MGDPAEDMAQPVRRSADFLCLCVRLRVLRRDQRGGSDLRRTLVALLALALVLSACPTTALAAPGDLATGSAFSDIVGHPAETALTILGALGVFQGGHGLGGPVEPDSPITRAQYCKVVVVGTDRAQLADMMKYKPAFKDADSIPDWAWGYVNAAQAEGIITGFPDGTFRPNEPVSYVQAIAMLIRSVAGHKGRVGPEPWPWNILFYGIPRGFTGDVAIVDPNAPCPRGDMARMLLATMQVDPLDEDGAPITDGAILEEGVRLWNRVFLDRSGGDMALEGVMGPVSLGEPVYLLGASSYEQCRGMGIMAVAKKDRKVVCIKRQAGTTLGDILVETGSDSGGTYLKLKAVGKVYCASSVAVTLNRETGHTVGDLAAGDSVTINVNAEGKAVAVQATRYDLIHFYLPLLPPLHSIDELHDDYIASYLAPSGSTPARVTFPAGSMFSYYRVGVGFQSLAGVTLEVGSGCAVYLNGVSSSLSQLAQYDVIKGATLGARGYDGPSSVVEIRATRSAVEGVVKQNFTRTDVHGTRYFVQMDVGGVLREYERDAAHYLTTEPLEDVRHKFGRSENGMLFFEIGLPTEHPVVYVKSAATGSGTYRITCDLRGTEVTYDCTSDRSAWVGKIVRLTVDGATGKVTAGDDYTPPTTATYKILGKTSSSVTFQTIGVFPPTTYYGEEPVLVVYRKVGSELVYIGIAGLAVNDVVHAYIVGGVPQAIVLP